MTAPVWGAQDYAPASAHHRAHDSEILAPLGLMVGQRVADVGCGTGELTETIADVVGPSGEVVGIEPDPSLYAAAAARTRPGLRFVQSRAQDLDPAVVVELDAVVSVAALHWVPAEDHAGVLARLGAVLRHGGLLRLDFGGHGQIEMAREVLAEVGAAYGTPENPWFFPTPEAYAELLAAAGFSLANGWCQLLKQRRPFADEAAIRGWLRSQVVIAYSAGLDPAAAAAFSAEAEERCVQKLRRANGSYDQDYVRIDVLARKD